MSRSASVTLDWADGTYHFRLAWAELIGLQEARDCGPQVIRLRLESMQWRVEDIAAVIRFGLIGGGKTPVEAMQLVRTYVEARPPMENLLTAQAILAAAIVGVPDEEPSKKKPPAEATD